MFHFFAFLNRMKYIKRWSLMRSVVEENISEHSQQVAVIAHALAVIRNTYFGGTLSPDRVAAQALFHETSEVITGDLPTPIKYFNREINTAYKDLEHLANQKLLNMLPPEMQSIYAEYLSDADAEIHQIVKAADKISAYIKCIEEVRSGNGEFKKAKTQIKGEIQKFSLPEVRYFLEKFLPSFELTLDELD